MDGCSDKLFGLLPPWHDGLCQGGEIEVNDLNDLLVIGFNVVDMLLVIMVIAALIFFVVGCIKLIASSGKPDSVASANKTIGNSVIGLALGLSAGSISSYISAVANNATSGGDQGDPEAFSKVLEILIQVGAAIAVIMIVKAAISYITGGGDASKIASAKNTLVYVVIGIILLVSAYTLVSLLVGSLGS